MQRNLRKHDPEDKILPNECKKQCNAHPNPNYLIDILAAVHAVKAELTLLRIELNTDRSRYEEPAPRQSRT